jgi:hypothetical protein
MISGDPVAAVGDVPSVIARPGPEADPLDSALAPGDQIHNPNRDQSDRERPHPGRTERKGRAEGDGHNMMQREHVTRCN